MSDRPRWEPVEPMVSTGELPSRQAIFEALRDAYHRGQQVDAGKVADYIPILAEADPSWFGVCLTGARGAQVAVGDTEVPFSIQSVSKPFVFALVCEAIGAEEAREKLGVNSTGLPFDSVMAVELNADRTMNPMVNAGAMATTSLVPGTTPAERWEWLVAGMSEFAGRPLTMNQRVYESESATNLRNQGIAHLLDGYGCMYSDPDEATDLYTRQCSLEITTIDLSIMGATLADGGVNPMTGARVIDERLCRRVLAVLATAGMYERSGDWLFDVGLPGKSGVSGGMVTIAPGKGSVATFSPPLDEAGNSVRGQIATHHLSEALGLNLFASTPLQGDPEP